MGHPFFAEAPPLVIGHRGACGEAPENTLPSFRRALEDGAVILETDVHTTRDGVPVLCHDPVVDRTTDGEGAIAELPFQSLRQLDAGFRFAAGSGAFPFRGRGIRIPSLEEALLALPGVRFNIEIKVCDGALIERVLEILARCEHEPRALVTAAEDETMALLREQIRLRGSQVAQGASAGDVAAFLRGARAGGDVPPEPMALQIPPSFQGIPLVDRALIDFAHARGVQVHVWTVNEEAEIRRLLGLGIDGVISDYPARVRAIVEEVRGAA